MNNDKTNTIEDYEDYAKKKMLEAAKKMLEEGDSKDKICRVTGLEERDFVE